jgi:toxin ParE1/3/4
LGEVSNLLVSFEARNDIGEALEFLRERSPVLPSRFRSSLEETYRDIAEYPEMHPLFYRRFRRALLRHFPYSVFYLVDEATLLIVAVIHQAQHPHLEAADVVEGSVAAGLQTLSTTSPHICRVTIADHFS